MQNSISVVFPVYNEEEIIAKTIYETLDVIKEITEEYEIIVVNDASTDNTPHIIAELSQKITVLKIINHKKNRKLGGSLKSGFKSATKDLILYSDADMPFDIHKLKDAVMILQKDNADMVCGYRFNRKDEGTRRYAYSFLYNAIIRCLFKPEIRDINFSFKLFRRRILESVHLVSESSFIMAELLIKSYRRRFKVVQFGVTYFPRKSGISRLSRPSVIIKILYELVLFLTKRGRFREESARNLIPRFYSEGSLKEKLHIYFRMKTCPFEYIETFVPMTGTILDFGCGQGIFCHVLALKSPERRIIGIDASSEKIDTAIKSIKFRDYEKNIVFFVNDTIHDLGIAELKCIVIIDVLYLIHKRFQEAIFYQCYQRLNKNGILIIKTMKKRPAWKYWVSYFQEIISVRLLKITQGNGFYFPEEGELKKFLEAVGFKVSILGIDKGSIHPSALYICEKP